MRIASYNIYDGGEGRADPLAEVILAQRADVVALVEADDEEVVRRIARRTGMDYVYGPGRKHAAAFLSRSPIIVTINHALLRPITPLSLLEVCVRSSGGDVWIGVVHLSAHAREADEDKRMNEVGTMLDVFQSHRDRALPHLLVGDFNSNSPVQQIDPGKCNPATRDEWHLNGGELPRRVVQRILDAGYVDTLHAIYPHRAATHGTFSTQFPGQRVDYIFTHGLPPDVLVDAWIEQDRLAKFASDHFPIGAEIASGGRTTYS